MNTGEVVVGEGQTVASGDAVNIAARLEQAAQPGEILIGDETFRLRNAKFSGRYWARTSDLRLVEPAL